MRSLREAPCDEVAVFVGPEGDFTYNEEEQLRSRGATPVSLGPAVLRAETAAIYALSILGYELRSATQRPSTTNH